jgi:hypothetical protein
VIQKGNRHKANGKQNGGIVFACCLLPFTFAMLAPAVASGQTPRNPFESLFGRPPERPGRGFTSLDFRTTTGVQFAAILDADGDGNRGEIPEGISAGADAQLQLSHLSDRIEAQGFARYAYQEYRREPAFGAPGYDAGGQIVMKATSRLSFDAGGRYTSSPFFHLMTPPALTFGQVTMPGDPFIAWLLDNDSVEATAGVTAGLSRRSSVNLIGRWRETRFADSPGDNFSARGFRAQWNRRLSRDLGVHAGYGRDEVRQRRLGDSPFMHELVDIGVDYSKALPIARRTSIAFTTETSVLRENGGGRRYRLNGSFELGHGFARTWRASLSAFRATEFLPGIPLPVFSDNGRISLSGFLSKHLILHTNAYASTSTIGFEQTGKYITYTGDARLTFAMTRHLGIFGQYVYYHYQLPPDANSVVQLPALSRQMYAIGVQAWVPLIDKDRVTRDPR